MTAAMKGPSAFEIVAFVESDGYDLHHIPIHGQPMDTDMRVLICASVDPEHAAEMLEEAARRMRDGRYRGEPQPTPPTLQLVCNTRRRIGGADA